MSNTPITALIQEYKDDGYDFSNINNLINTSLRYVSSMEDSQVRCLLYVMAQELNKWHVRAKLEMDDYSKDDVKHLTRKIKAEHKMQEETFKSLGMM